MNSKERIKAAVSLNRPDRVPTAPLIGPFALRHRGVPQSQGYKNPALAFEAILDTFNDLGGYDGIVSPDIIWPNSSWRMTVAPTPLRVPGQLADEDEHLQVLEKEIFTLLDYDTIINRGWNGFCEEFLPRVTGRPLEKIDASQKRLLQTFVVDAQKWDALGVVAMMGASSWDPMMILSLGRTLTTFTLDLYRYPDKVQAAMDAMVGDLIENVIDTARATKIPWVSVPLERGSGSLYSLKIFERFGFPYIKKMVEAFNGEGYITILHLDTDWTTNLPYFKDLPRGKCICELDSTTDIFKAKEILKNHMCIMGDVPASLLTLGTTEEVTAYCERLVDNIGEDGGFILSTGCECPVDAKFENVRAMLDAAKNRLPK